MAERSVPTVLVLIVLCMSFVLKLHHLGHTALKPLDESFHAIVAQNLLHHPLDPTLIDRPLLPSDENNWMASHVWLHKPPMALWQIALSFLLLGKSAWALRLPSALLSTGAAWITYRIGRRLLDPWAGAIAAGLQAFNPALLMLVHGYVFSDHVDIALLFWTELGVLLIVRCAQATEVREIRWSAIGAGIAQGLSFLTKSYPGLIVTAVAIGAWILWRIKPRDAELRLRGRHLLLIILAACVTAAPYLVYAAVTTPNEFLAAYVAMLQHAQEGVEGFGAPWDRLWFDYAAGAFYLFYVTALASAVLLTMRMMQTWNAGRSAQKITLLLLWGAGVFVTMTLTTNKTPSATTIGWPVGFLLIGAIMSNAARGDAAAMGIWLVAMVAAVVYPGRYLSGGIGSPIAGGEAAIARQQLWIVWELLAALSGGLVAAYTLPTTAVRVRRVLVASAIIAMLWIALTPRWHGRPPGYAIAAYDVTTLDREAPDLVELGEFAKHLPASAGLLLAERSKLEHNTLMFYGERTVYGFDPAREKWESLAQKIGAAGGVPYLVTAEQLPLTKVFVPHAGDRFIYACDSSAKSHSIAGD